MPALSPRTLPILLSLVGCLAAPWSHAETVAPKPDGIRACARPEWPKEALLARHTGTVTLSLRIDADGSVGDTQVAKSSGHPLLDQAAADAIGRCKFRPGVANGKPVSARMQLQYVWTLDEAGKVPAVPADAAKR